MQESGQVDNFSHCFFNFVAPSLHWYDLWKYHSKPQHEQGSQSHVSVHNAAFVIFVIYIHTRLTFLETLYWCFIIAHKKYEPPHQQVEKSSPGLQPIIQLPQFIFQGVLCFFCSLWTFFQWNQPSFEAFLISFVIIFSTVPSRSQSWISSR